MDYQSQLIQKNKATATKVKKWFSLLAGLALMMALALTVVAESAPLATAHNHDQSSQQTSRAARAAANAPNKIYWTDENNHTIQRADLDGSNVETLLSGLSAPQYIAIDETNHKMYWASLGDDKIYYANTDGSNQQELLATGNNPVGIALDVANNKIYWTEALAGNVRRANLDGSLPEDLIIGVNGSLGIALDLTNNKLYYSLGDFPQIRRADLNGTNDALFLTAGTRPDGIALDVANDKIYWREQSSSQKVRSATLSDGSEVTNLLTGGSSFYGGVGLDLSNNKLYYGDGNKIGRANLDGTSPEDVVTGQNTVVGVIAAYVPPAEINVKQGTTDIADGGTFDFGSVNVGSHADLLFTIENSGADPLSLGAETIAGTNSGDFALQGAFPSGPIAGGGSDTFTVRFTPSAIGARSATIEFVNGDADENPYNFTLNGTGTAPEINVKQGTDDIADGSGTIDFGSVNVGSNTDLLFTIENRGNLPLTLGAETIAGTNDSDFALQGAFPSGPIAAGQSTTFTVRFTPGATGARSATIEFVNGDADENPYNFTLNGTGTAPEINVKQGTDDIADGSSTIDFGSVNVGSHADLLFTIENTGDGPLTLGAETIAGTNSGDFALQGAFPSSSIAAGAQETFTVRFTPGAIGARSATIEFVNEDADENPYNFTFTGTGTQAATPTPAPTPNQPPQVHTPCPDITVIEGAADHIMNPFDCFSDPEGDHMMFYVTGNSNAQVVPNLSEGQKLGNVDQYAIQFGSVGETDITIQAKETWSHAITEETFKVTVLPRPTLSIAKSASKRTVSAGERVTYTIQISNTGVSTATNTLISDTLPVGTSFVSNSIAASGVTTGTVGTQPPYLASGVTISPSHSIELTYAVTISDTVLANQLITNAVKLTSTELITPVRATHTMQVISPTLTISDSSASEIDNRLTFIATLSRASISDVSVEYETVPDVATTDDYTATTGSLIIPAYALTGTISVPIKNDLLTETDETFSLRFSNAQNATLMTQQATGTIIDNDGDSDSDGVLDQTEDGVPSTGSGHGNESGDGNGDGVADSQQLHVTSLKSSTGDYVTFATQEGKQLANMSSSMPTEAQTQDGVEFPLGLFDFAVTGIETGAAFSVTLTLHTDEMTPNSYWKYGPTADNPSDHLYNFAFDAQTGTGAVVNGNTITLHFVDGQRGDADLEANGQISDPGGPAIYQPPTALELTDFSRQQPNQRPIWLLIGIIFVIGSTLLWHKRTN